MITRTFQKNQRWPKVADNTLQAMQQRITDLESRLEFQDETIAQLNDELVVHQRGIATLTRQLQLLAKRLPDKDVLSHDPEVEPPPPHY